MQLLSTPGFTAPPSNDAGWLAHLGIRVQDLESALAEAQNSFKRFHPCCWISAFA